MAQRTFETLSEPESFALIGGEVVGRFVFNDGEGPAAVPVNFGLAGKDIIFRTEKRTNWREFLKGPVAFEVDFTDPASGWGWSVLVRGTGREVDLNDVPALLHASGKSLPHPWGDGVHDVWIAITPRQVTGRRLAKIHTAEIF